MRFIRPVLLTSALPILGLAMGGCPQDAGLFSDVAGIASSGSIVAPEFEVGESLCDVDINLNGVASDMTAGIAPLVALGTGGLPLGPTGAALEVGDVLNLSRQVGPVTLSAEVTDIQVDGETIVIDYSLQGSLNGLPLGGLASSLIAPEDAGTFSAFETLSATALDGLDLWTVQRDCSVRLTP